MEKDERLQILKSLPKVDLHRHLEGSLRLGTMLDLGRKYGVELPLDSPTSLLRAVTYTDGEPRTLRNFLSKFHADWYRSYADVEQVTREVVADAAEEGVVHLELRFSPEHLTRLSGLDPRGTMEAITESGAAEAAEQEIGVRFLVTFVRERYDYDFWKQIIDTAAKMAEQGIAGVDLAGDEFDHPNHGYEKIFRRVIDTGVLGVTIHAGEGTSSGQVSSAVALLGATRIGHGLKAVDDPAVIRFLAEKQITLEMCPISNYQTGCIDDLQLHPLPLLDRAGVPVTINSDDPTIHQTNINHDYDMAVTRWQYTLSDLLRLERNAVRAAFLSGEEKNKLLFKVEQGYGEAVNQGLL